MGLDSREAETRIERIVTFDVDGQSLLLAQISNASATGIRLCMWREAAIDERECVRGRNVALERAVTDSGQTRWHVSMIGTQQSSPHVTLTVRFNADAPRVMLDNFRYVGTAFEEYNGFAAELAPLANGNLRIVASIEDGEGGSYPYRLLVQRLPGGETVLDETGGPTDAIDVSVPVTGGQSYRASLRSTEEFSADGLLPVFVSATLTWP